MVSLTATRVRAAPRGAFETTSPLDAAPAPEIRARTAHRPGDLIAGRYRIDRLVERGGMATVHAGTDLELQRIVALKIASSDSLHAAGASERLLREARLLARLQHPNIAAIHDHGRTPDGTPFLVLEMVTGTTLRQFLAHTGALSWRTAVAIATQIASGLHAAHTRGVVHCDLTPSNVLIARTDQGGLVCKVIDFGIAEHELEHRSAPICGTRRYAAPETLHGAQVRADVRIDLYALGAMLGEMLGDVAADAPTALTTLAASLQAPDPALRPASAATVLDALRRIAASEGRSPPAPTRLAWCAAGAAVALAVGAMVSVVSTRDTKAEPAASRIANAAPIAPVRAELAPVPLQIPVQAVDFKIAPADPPRRATRPKPAPRVAAAAPRATPRVELEAAVAKWRDGRDDAGSFTAAPLISLDPSERSARVVHRATAGSEVARDLVQYWVLRDGRWQLLGD